MESPEKIGHWGVSKSPIRSQHGNWAAFHLLLLWVMFTATAPFAFFEMIPGHPYKLLVVVGIAIMIVMFMWRLKVKLGDPILLTIILAQAVYCLIAAYLHELFFLGMDYGYVSLSVQFTVVAIVYLYIITFFSIHEVAKSAIYVIAIMGVMGAIAFILGISGLIGPLTSLGIVGDRTVYNFFLTYSPAALYLSGHVIIRVAGFFTEPGVFAFYITFALLTNKLYDYSKRLEWVLIVTGIFTLSIAFFFILICYCFVYYRRQMLKRLPLLIIFILAIGVFAASEWVGSAEEDGMGWSVFKLTIGRLASSDKDSGRIIEGDNRSDLMALSWNAFIDSPLIGHGESGTINSASKYYGAHLGANSFAPLAVHGIIGVSILFLAYFYWGYLIFIYPCKRDPEAIGAWFILTLNLLPKPQVYGGLYGYFAIIFLIEATRYRLSSTQSGLVPNERIRV